MLKDISREQWPELLFNNLVLSLSNAAMMAMGKIVPPGSEKVEKDLEMAQMNIEMLSMLENKTRNNLSEKESALISATLTNLRMTYVRELDRETRKSKS
ncbi:DUF1844 domain-containing protein [bacterium]|nr:DUF1844 domain-containing protein [candidate division CSSED10-310 bacterium]